MSLYPVSINQRSAAIEIFQATRRKAYLGRLVNRLLRRYQPLVDFTDLTGVQSDERTSLGLQVVPLNQINGSVNRKGDFDRRFRPLRKHLCDRWVNIYMLMQTDGWEPVTLYKVGEKYYVEDGHHRVSVAITSGRQYIEAQLWEYVAVKQPYFYSPVLRPVQLKPVPTCCEEGVSA